LFITDLFVFIFFSFQVVVKVKDTQIGSLSQLEAASVQFKIAVFSSSKIHIFYLYTLHTHDDLLVVFKFKKKKRFNNQKANCMDESHVLAQIPDKSGPSVYLFFYLVKK
jgi:hypothetical protein